MLSRQPEELQLFSAANILLLLPTLVLIMARLTGLMLAAPVFSSRAIPRRIKAAFVMVSACVLLPMVSAATPPQISLGVVVGGMVVEMLIGAAIGLVVTMMASGVEYAANLVGQQAGLSLAQVYDPTLNQETSELGQLYSIVFFMSFLLVGGHRAMFAALLDTFKCIPPLSFVMGESLVATLTQVMNSALALGIRIGAPVMLSMLVLILIMGFLSRTIPQLNVLTIGFNLKVVLLLAACGLTLTFCDELIADAITDSVTWARQSVGSGGPAPQAVGNGMAAAGS